jgi:hypothetical protein
MTPAMSVYLHTAGILSTSEALWIYNSDGMVVANKAAMIKDGEPVF